jgi:lysine 2,3-aminomutase
MDMFSSTRRGVEMTETLATGFEHDSTRNDVKIPSLKPPVSASDLEYRNLRDDEFWRALPGFADVDRETFNDHKWQMRNSVTKEKRLFEILGDRVDEAFMKEVTAGFQRASMSMRVSPYLLSLIDWDDPYTDPIRAQFIPLGSRFQPDHPMLHLDSLAEQVDAPVPGLTHRYPDKALFLVLDTCPVYCRFCTRSYAVGVDTEQVEKVAIRVNRERWARAFEYIQSRPELEDIVISGGDAYNMRPEQITEIGNTLLSFENVRRLRWATKGPAVMPMKLLTHDEWFSALAGVVDRGRKMGKQVVIHTHFSHPNEITAISQRALGRCFNHGITVRNQCVLLQGVNDTPETMIKLVKRLGHINVEPYYVYMHDLVRGVEDLRTTLTTGLDIEKRVRGVTAGFNTPTFVVDTMGGGGKRAIHSYERYNRTTGVSVYTAPSVKKDQFFFYLDPIHLLPEEGQARWADPSEHSRIIEEAIREAR